MDVTLDVLLFENLCIVHVVVHAAVTNGSQGTFR